MPGPIAVADTARPRTDRRRAAVRRAAGAVAVVLLVGAAAACGGDDVSDGDKKDTTSSTTTSSTTGAATNPTGGLARTSWKLRGAVAAASVPTLDFAQDGTFAGSTGCNRLSGTWTEDGTSLTLEPGPMTKAACTTQEATDQEDRIVAALPEVKSFEQTETTLTLTDADGQDLLSYDAVTGDLAGTSWKVTGVNTGTAVEASALTEKLTIDFGTEGSVTGHGGCNNFKGTYELEGGAISFSEFASTMMGCDDAVMQMEDKYLAALAASTTVERSGDSLTLRDDAGAMQVTAIVAN
ncbi:META domain-containing protein [Dermatobacter hominis]|uniref:META domain-containing protein n=1 Tax=Dermatobacter hominis TaxID=2884263 RepID=UPI001D0F4C9F|nr:META domain-containing protein [Dermatobacter hominis]UDY34768.1 META domain-containing protein [Dermatobacter hominis]